MVREVETLYFDFSLISFVSGSLPVYETDREYRLGTSLRTSHRSVKGPGRPRGRDTAEGATLVRTIMVGPGGEDPRSGVEDGGTSKSNRLDPQNHGGFFGVSGSSGFEGRVPEWERGGRTEWPRPLGHFPCTLSVGTRRRVP